MKPTLAQSLADSLSLEARPCWRSLSLRPSLPSLHQLTRSNDYDSNYRLALQLSDIRGTHL